MTDEEEIGEITIKSEHDVEWKIDKIFSFTKEEESYSSPYFTLSDCDWYFEIYPNGYEGYAGRISLFLGSDCSSDEGATYSFGIKKCDGKADKERSNLSWIFNENARGLGSLQFFERSELIERKSELAPQDTLTITCTLWKYDNFHSTAKTSTFSSNLLEMFTSQEACDATLQVKQEKFPVHKVILMAQSPVFAAMFKTPMKEKTTGIVNIEDCDPLAFREFLVYLYSGKLEKVTNHMFELYEIADKYNVQDLKSDCVIAMMGNLSVENITDSVCLAERFGEDGLKIKAKNFFNKNCSEILRTSKWLNYMKKYPDLANGLLTQMVDHLKK